MSSYIITFKPTATKAQIDAYADKIVQEGGEIEYRYYEEANSVLWGFSAKIPDVHTFEATDFDGIIDYVEPDGEVTTFKF